MSRALAHWRRVMLMKRRMAGAVAALRRVQSWQSPARSSSVMAACITLAFLPQARQPLPPADTVGDVLLACTVVPSQLSVEIYHRLLEGCISFLPQARPSPLADSCINF